MTYVAGTAKRLLAAGVLGLGLIGLAPFAGVGTAVADGTLPDTGSYDELTNIPDPDGTQGDFDDDGLQADDVRNSVNPR